MLISFLILDAKTTTITSTQRRKKKKNKQKTNKKNHNTRNSYRDLVDKLNQEIEKENCGE